MMNSSLLLATLIALVSAASGAFLTYKQELQSWSWKEEWLQFRANFSKKYLSDSEEEKRFKIFQKNMNHIAMHNHDHVMGKTSFHLTVNEFADLEPGELKQQRNGFRHKLLNTNYTSVKELGGTFMEPFHVQMPNQVDWRKEGYVTPVKNQGACGSCWSFSATGALEGQWFRKTGRLPSLSEQNLVDCSKKWGNNGCDGGLMDQAFQYIKDNGGIDSEASYPYEGQDDVCRYDPSSALARDNGFIDIPSGSEEKLQMAVATQGPISVAIDAGHSSFQFYHHGVYEEPECSQTELDHGVLVVGYGTENGKDFWLVKNSWGESWGELGFIKMRRNKRNMCGIATQASYPIV